MAKRSPGRSQNVLATRLGNRLALACWTVAALTCFLLVASFVWLSVNKDLSKTETIQINGSRGSLEAAYTPVANASDIVVILPGSGPTDRDGNSSQGLLTNTYKLIAQGLQKQGIASIRIDKRGMYGSAKAVADANAVTVEDYASDARAWIAKAKSYAPCVWLAGHSEGGLVALAAAQKSQADICGLILLATPGRPLGIILREQLRANPANAPILAEAEAIITDLEAGKRREEAKMTPALQPLFATAIQPFLIDLFRFDPAKLGVNWTKPTLIVDGDKDIQVLLADGAALAAAMPSAKYVTLNGATHTLKTDVLGQPYATYTDLALPLHSQLIAIITNYVKLQK